jgi:hypothetical protein
MDLEPGRTRVHEYAETGKPQPAQKLHRTRWRLWAFRPVSSRAVRLCTRLGWNGPAVSSGMVGHKLSAIGLPHQSIRSVCSACPYRQPAQRAALQGSPPRIPGLTGDSMVIPLASPLPFRFRASFSGLAVIPAGECRWTERYDGKRDLHLQHAARNAARNS